MEGLSEENDIGSEAGLIYRPAIEIISLDDDRLKMFGEELANDTGLAILKCIFDGKGTAGEIANELKLSLPLVVYHLQRLVKTEIIVDKVELSRKGREMKRYSAQKLGILINLNPRSDATKIKRRLESIIWSSIAVSLSGIAYTILQAEKIFGSSQIIVSDPDNPMLPIMAIAPFCVIAAGVAGASITARIRLAYR